MRRVGIELTLINIDRPLPGFVEFIFAIVVLLSRNICLFAIFAPVNIYQERLSAGRIWRWLIAVEKTDEVGAAGRWR
jgi:hypothetical protein